MTDQHAVSISLNWLRNVSLSHCFRQFQSGHWPQVPANQGFTNRLNSGRYSGFSLSLAHSNEPEHPARIAGASISLNRHRIAQFRHRFIPFEPRAFIASACGTGTCDKYKTGPFDGITSWFTSIKGSPTGALGPFVAEPTQN